MKNSTYKCRMRYVPELPLALPPAENGSTGSLSTTRQSSRPTLSNRDEKASNSSSVGDFLRSGMEMGLDVELTIDM